MSDKDLFQTGRMSTLRHLAPAYMPGEHVYLQRDVQEFARGSRAKVVSVQSSRPGEHRYQILVNEKKLWAYEADLRPTPPGDNGMGTTAPQRVLPNTQRMQTLTLTQQMSALGDAANTLGVSQRMHTLSQAERMKQMVATNRLRTLGDGTAAPGQDTTPPPLNGEPGPQKP